jgi:hypothetical protein
VWGGVEIMSDYPTNSQLRKIEKWDFSTTIKLFALLNFLDALWRYGDVGYYELKGKTVLRLRLSTAGWSGNESIIQSLKVNMFWGCFWERSKRGGHYWFEINLKTFFPKDK